MNCNIIKDLLPSYVDGICSEDTVELIEEHLHTCDDCKKYLAMMKTDYAETIPEPDRAAIAPFKKINKKRRIQVITATILTFTLTVIAAMVIQDVRAVNQIFFPMASANVVIESDENTEDWEKLSFEGQDYLTFDNFFWKKEITNHANNNSEILIRVKDEDGKILINELKILPGASVKLDNLKTDEKYIVEFKTKTAGLYLINAT